MYNFSIPCFDLEETDTSAASSYLDVVNEVEIHSEPVPDFSNNDVIFLENFTGIIQEKTSSILEEHSYFNKHSIIYNGHVDLFFLYYS